MPANEWVEQPQQSMVIGHWENPQASVQQTHGAPPGLQQIDNWTYAADPAQSDPGWIQPQHQHLQHQTAAAMYPGAHQQYMVSQFYNLEKCIHKLLYVTFIFFAVLITSSPFVLDIFAI